MYWCRFDGGRFREGKIYLQIYRSDYTKDKMLLDDNNLFKVAYAFWSATAKPLFMRFLDVLSNMIKSGEYVFHGKMLLSSSLDTSRSDAAWLCLLKPHKG
jgi:hypothetical protein